MPHKKNDRLSQTLRNALRERFKPTSTSDVNQSQDHLGLPPRPAPIKSRKSSARRGAEDFPEFRRIATYQAVGRRLGIRNPYFLPHDGVASATSSIEGHQVLNFASYNYLGLVEDPRVKQAAKDAIDTYGTSASASRLIGGERPVQRELEQALADFYGADDAVVFVSGHATNVTTIGSMFGPGDLVVHDAFIHNSVVEGCRLSGATRLPFRHNDPQSLVETLAKTRARHKRLLICIEGLYSMDGDTPPLTEFIKIKERFDGYLMVDEAHSLGVLGERGRGVAELHDADRSGVDLWMGTLSKTLAGCGGFIAANQGIVDLLKYSAPGFVYSVGLSPPLAAASLCALEILCSEPGRVVRLHQRAREFLNLARHAGVDTGLAEGHAVVPAVIADSVAAVKLSGKLLTAGLNVQPIVYPAVEESAARLRFFITSEHTSEHIQQAVSLLSRNL